MSSPQSALPSVHMRLSSCVIQRLPVLCPGLPTFSSFQSLQCKPFDPPTPVLCFFCGISHFFDPCAAFCPLALVCGVISAKFAGEFVRCPHFRFCRNCFAKMFLLTNQCIRQIGAFQNFSQESPDARVSGFALYLSAIYRSTGRLCQNVFTHKLVQNFFGKRWWI